MKFKILSSISFFVALIFLLSFVQALSVGSFPYSKEKTVNAGEAAKFTLGFFNLDKNPAKVLIDVETELKVDFPEGKELLLNPKEEGGSWFYLGDGNYVKTKSLSFLVYAPNISYNFTYPIKVRVISFPLKNLEKFEIAQTVSQSTQYFFKLNVIGNESFSKNLSLKEVGESKKSFEKKEIEKNIKIAVGKEIFPKGLEKGQKIPTGQFSVGIEIGYLGIIVFTIVVVLIIILRGRY